MAINNFGALEKLKICNAAVLDKFGSAAFRAVTCPDKSGPEGFRGADLFYFYINRDQFIQRCSMDLEC